MTPLDPPPRPADVWAVHQPLWALAARGHDLGTRLLVLLAYLVLVGGGYLLVLRIAEWRGVSAFDSTGAVDRWVPAWPWTVYVYFTLYLWFPLTTALAPRGLRGIRALLLHLQAEVVLSLATYPIFLLLPTEITVRREMEELLGSTAGLTHELFEYLYSVDSPWNAWPSLHVSTSLLMLFTCVHFTRVKRDRHRWWRRGRADVLFVALAVPAWVALSLSIMTTKQHFFLDVWTGVLAGLLVWIFYLRGRLLRLEAQPVQNT